MGPSPNSPLVVLPVLTLHYLQKHSTDTLVDSGFYRAGEAVDNVSEFYRPASDYVTYQVLLPHCFLDPIFFTSQTLPPLKPSSLS